MEPFLTTVLVWTREHGIEPVSFSNHADAFSHVANLKELQAYRFVNVYVSRIEITPTDLLECVIEP